MGKKTAFWLGLLGTAIGGPVGGAIGAFIGGMAEEDNKTSSPKNPTESRRTRAAEKPIFEDSASPGGEIADCIISHGLFHQGVRGMELGITANYNISSVFKGRVEKYFILAGFFNTRGEAIKSLYQEFAAPDGMAIFAAEYAVTNNYPGTNSEGQFKVSVFVPYGIMDIPGEFRVTKLMLKIIMHRESDKKNLACRYLEMDYFKYIEDPRENLFNTGEQNLSKFPWKELFALATYVVKAGGRPNSRELAVLKRAFLPRNASSRDINDFQKVVEKTLALPSRDILQMVQVLNDRFTTQMKLELVGFLFQLADANNSLNLKGRERIEKIAKIFGVNNSELQLIEASSSCMLPERFCLLAELLACLLGSRAIDSEVTAFIENSVMYFSGSNAKLADEIINTVLLIKKQGKQNLGGTIRLMPKFFQQQEHGLLFDFCLGVSLSDGQLKAYEKRIILKLAKELGIDQNGIDNRLDEYTQNLKNGKAQVVLSGLSQPTGNISKTQSDLSKNVQSGAREKSPLQQKIEAAPPNAVINLLPGEYQGPLILKKGITINGNGSTIWCRKGPVLEIEGDLVKIKDLRIEVTDKTPENESLDFVALKILNKQNFLAENIEVHGQIYGETAEEGIWKIPRSINIGKIRSEEPWSCAFRVQIPVKCKFISSNPSIIVSSDTIEPGSQIIKISVLPLGPDASISCPLWFVTPRARRRVQVSLYSVAEEIFQDTTVLLWDCENLKSQSLKTPENPIRVDVDNSPGPEEFLTTKSVEPPTVSETTPIQKVTSSTDIKGEQVVSLKPQMSEADPERQNIKADQPEVLVDKRPALTRTSQDDYSQFMKPSAPHSPVTQTCQSDKQADSYISKATPPFSENVTINDSKSALGAGKGVQKSGVPLKDGVFALDAKETKSALSEVRPNDQIVCNHDKILNPAVSPDSLPFSSDTKILVPSDCVTKSSDSNIVKNNEKKDKPRVIVPDVFLMPKKKDA